MTKELIPAMEYYKEQHKKIIILRFDEFELEFESTEDVVNFVCAYTKAQKEQIEDDYQVL